MNQRYPVVVLANVSRNDDTSNLRNAIFIVASRIGVSPLPGRIKSGSRAVSCISGLLSGNGLVDYLGLLTWLDSWSGIGHLAVGTARQGFDLQLMQYDDRGWRATFYTTGMEHSPTSATGTAWERTPWHAVQRAAREALKSAEK